MNPIDAAVNDAVFEMDSTILDLAFFRGKGLQLTSIRDRIKELVVYPYVLPHINAESGNVIYIPKSSMSLVEKTNQGMEILISDPQLDDREIVTPLSIIDSNHGVIEDHIMDREVYTNLTLLHKNTIYIHDADYLPYNALLKCSVTYTDVLSELPPGSHLEISKFVSLAIKVFVYARVNLLVEQGFIYNGAELTGVSSVVSEYSTALEEYRIMREEVIPKVLDMSSSKFMEKYIDTMFFASF